MAANAPVSKLKSITFYKTGHISATKAASGLKFSHQLFKAFSHRSYKFQQNMSTYGRMAANQTLVGNLWDTLYIYCDITIY